jgi:hypothetical protein
MLKLILGMLMIGSILQADWKYIQGIDNGSYSVYKTDKQSIRQFKTTKPGYVNIVASPWYCAESIMLLDSQNKVIGERGQNISSSLNVGIPEGQYYIQVIPKQDCIMNIAVPQ